MRRHTALIFFVVAVAVISVAVFGFGISPSELHAATAAGGIMLCDGGAAPALSTKELEARFDESIKLFGEANDNVKKLAEDAQKQLADTQTLSAETRAAVDKALVQFSGLAAQVGDIEQKLQKRQSAKVAEPTTPGGRLVQSEAFKGLNANTVKRGTIYQASVPHSSLNMDLPLGAPLAAITTQGTAGVLVEEMRIPGVLPLPQRRMTVRNLCAPGRTISNAFKYIRETGFTNLADVVSEGTSKPESTLAFDAVTGNVATIAHWMKASRQILDDAPALASMIDNRLRYGLMLKEEAQLLRGDGLGDNLEGLITAATAYDGSIVDIDQETEIDEIRKAILQVFLAEYPATGIVMNPVNWARIEMRKTKDGAYLMANPASVLNKTLWGLPVVDTQAMDVGEFLVGAFAIAAQIFDREDANVAVSTEDGNNFIQNMVTILCEERLALAIYRPEALVTGDFVHTSNPAST